MNNLLDLWLISRRGNPSRLRVTPPPIRRMDVFVGSCHLGKHCQMSTPKVPAAVERKQAGTLAAVRNYIRKPCEPPAKILNISHGKMGEAHGLWAYKPLDICTEPHVSFT